MTRTQLLLASLICLSIGVAPGLAHAEDAPPCTPQISPTFAGIAVSTRF